MIPSFALHRELEDQLLAVSGYSRYSSPFGMAPISGRILARQPHRGDVWRNDHGAVGLGTGGSGDVLAGLIAGLVGRGAAALTATLWGVFVHARIGQQLTENIGRLGFLAREISPEIPGMLDAIAGSE